MQEHDAASPTDKDILCSSDKCVAISIKYSVSREGGLLTRNSAGLIVRTAAVYDYGY